MHYTPKKALTDLFKSHLEFNKPDEVYASLADACSKYGMNFSETESNVIEALGELFVLSVRGEIDYLGQIDSDHSEQPMFKAVFTTYAPHDVEMTPYFETVEQALKAMQQQMDRKTKAKKPKGKPTTKFTPNEK